MKETILKNRTKIIDSVKEHSLRFIFVKAMYFIVSFLFSRGCILGCYYPFSLSFSASVPNKNLTFSIIGSILGYLLPLRLGSGIRYISSTLCIGAIRWALSDLKKIKEHILYTPIITFISLFVTGIAVNCNEGINKHGIIITLLESFIASAIAYFFDITFKIISNKKVHNLSIRDFVCLSISVGVLLLSFSEVTIHGISFGRILAITIILISAYSIGIMGGAITGITTGIMLSLSSFGFAFLSGTYAFSGMISGMFFSCGKLGVVIAFILSYFIAFFRSVDMFQMIVGLYEVIIAVTIFLFLPENLIKTFKYSISFNNSNIENNYINKFFTNRLNGVSRCLSSVKGCIDKTTLEIRNFSPNNYNESCMDAVKDYCSNCGINKFCWEQNYKSTYYEIQNMIKNLTNGNNANSCNNRLRYCRNFDNISKRIENVRKDFSERELLNSKSEELKKVIGNHFSEISSVLDDISNSFTDSKLFDAELSLKIENILLSFGIKESNVSCIKSNNRIFIDIETNLIYKEKFNDKIFKLISSATGKKLDTPLFNVIDSKYRIQISEEKEFKINFSVSQHVFNGGKVCGDSCRCFQDSMGNFNVILSDGMGTGNSAAVNGTLVSELAKEFLKSGINTNNTVKLVNSAILLNSSEESLTALDILSIDLFTGKSKLIKAGSPETYLVRENKVQKLEFSSLPLGILDEVSFSSENFELKSGDWIILLSDGVTDIGENWIINLLNNIEYTTTTDIAKYIVDMSVKARKNTHDDDITAVVLSISR